MQPSLPGVLVASYWCYEGCNCKFNSDLELSKTVQLLDSFSHFLSHCNTSFEYLIHLLVFLFHVIIKVCFSFVKFVLYYYVKLFLISKNFCTNHSQLFPYLTILLMYYQNSPLYVPSYFYTFCSCIQSKMKVQYFRHVYLWFSVTLGVGFHYFHIILLNCVYCLLIYTDFINKLLTLLENNLGYHDNMSHVSPQNYCMECVVPILLL